MNIHYKLLDICIHWFPEIIRLDRETSFTSVEFRENAENIGIKIKVSGIEAQNYIGQRQQCQHLLRRIFNVINDTHLIWIKTGNFTSKYKR